MQGFSVAQRTSTLAGLRWRDAPKRCRNNGASQAASPRLPGVDTSSDHHQSFAEELDGANGAMSHMLADLIRLEFTPDQQDTFAQLWIFLIYPNSNLKTLKQAQQYFNLLLWRAGEVCNGRLAMLGICAVLANECVTRETLWQQVSARPWSLPAAYALLLTVAFVHHRLHTPTGGWGLWNRSAEITNGRLAMVAVSLVAAYEAMAAHSALHFLPRTCMEFVMMYLQFAAEFHGIHGLHLPLAC